MEHTREMMDNASKTNVERIKTAMKEKHSLFTVTHNAFNLYSQMQVTRLFTELSIGDSQKVPLLK